MDAITAEFALEALIDIAAPLNLGDTALGRRRASPITGGTFNWPRMAGEVVPGGAHWLNRNIFVGTIAVANPGAPRSASPSPAWSEFIPRASSARRPGR
jgi:hypothetical protein